MGCQGPWFFCRESTHRLVKGLTSRLTFAHWRGYKGEGGSVGSRVGKGILSRICFSNVCSHKTPPGVAEEEHLKQVWYPTSLIWCNKATGIWVFWSNGDWWWHGLDVLVWSYWKKTLGKPPASLLQFLSGWNPGEQGMQKQLVIRPFQGCYLLLTVMSACLSVLFSAKSDQGTIAKLSCWLLSHTQGHNHMPNREMILSVLCFILNLRTVSI